jgi:proteic killer suppression protein
MGARIKTSAGSLAQTAFFGREKRTGDCGVIVGCIPSLRSESYGSVQIGTHKNSLDLALVQRGVTRYTAGRMIRSFRHKGIEKFFLTGSKAGIQPSHARKLNEQLTVLNSATSPEQMNVPGWQLHALTSSLAAHWAISVNGNWRLTFRFDGEDAILVDYQDYH